MHTVTLRDILHHSPQFKQPHSWGWTRPPNLRSQKTNKTTLWQQKNESISIEHPCHWQVSHRNWKRRGSQTIPQRIAINAYLKKYWAGTRGDTNLEKTQLIIPKPSFKFQKLR